MKEIYTKTEAETEAAGAAFAAELPGGAVVALFTFIVLYVIRRKS